MGIDGKTRVERDTDAYIDNPTDGGIDRRTQDVEGNQKLDDILNTLGGAGNVVNTYDTISAVPQNTTTTVVTYTVPVGKTFELDIVEFSGENIAKYQIDIDATIEATRRTNYGADLSGEFNMAGVCLAAGTIIKLTVEHPRPMSADFEGRITGTLI